MGVVISLDTVRRVRDQGTVRLPAGSRERAVHDMVDIRNNMHAMRLMVADMEARLVDTSKRLASFVRDLEDGDRYRKRIMMTIEAVEAAMASGAELPADIEGFPRPLLAASGRDWPS